MRTRSLTMSSIASLLCFLLPLHVLALDRTVFVHLFEWTWKDIALECENVLGPGGFAAVQVSPPQEHPRTPDRTVPHLRHVSDRVWWLRYQPVSYKIESRSGTRQEFADMVKRCANVGVDVYVDLIMNHMAALDKDGVIAEGFNGTKFSKYEFEGVYTKDDFRPQQECKYLFSVPDDATCSDITSDAAQCQFLGLAELNTGQESVRAKLSAYIEDLIQLGVKGFRIDAAKLVSPEDMQAIISRTRTCDSQGKCTPYYFLEIRFNKCNTPEYFRDKMQDVDFTNFAFPYQLLYHFENAETRTLKDLRPIGENPESPPADGITGEFVNSGAAVVFTDNHDTQRPPKTSPRWRNMNYKQGALYELANIYMLAVPYGYPKLMSSFFFSDPDDPTPTVSPLEGNPVANGWVLEHRNPHHLAMVKFRNIVSGEFKQTDWWDDSQAPSTGRGNAIAFGRGSLGHVVINGERAKCAPEPGACDTATVFSPSGGIPTSMAPGRYCDILTGEPNAEGTECSGTHVDVGTDGKFKFYLHSLSALAFHVESRLTAFDAVCAQFDRVFLRGTFNDWEPTHQMVCVGGDVWELTVDFQDSPAVEFKFEMSGVEVGKPWGENYGLLPGSSGELTLDGSNINPRLRGLVTVQFNGATKTYKESVAATETITADGSCAAGGAGTCASG